MNLWGICERGHWGKTAVARTGNSFVQAHVVGTKLRMLDNTILMLLLRGGRRSSLAIVVMVTNPFVGDILAQSIVVVRIVREH